MAYDGQSDRTILFSGSILLTSGAIGLDSGETWSYDSDTNTWTNMTGGTRPSARYSHAMAYDAQSDRTILFGGHDDFGRSSDETWSYDLDVNANTWTNMTTGTGPSARFEHAMAYDAESDRIVLFGGVTGSGLGGDETWSYDFNTNTWTNMTAGTRPSGRWGHAMAYDAESDRIVLFGGLTDETWSYDVNTNTWTMLPPVPRPSDRYGHAMAYDAQSDRTILFGGYGSADLSDETWSYDFNTNTWTNMNPGTRPDFRYYHPVVYDAGSDRIVLFGGQTNTVGRSDDTWNYDLETNRWTDSVGRIEHAMAYDAQSDRTIMFGGYTMAGEEPGNTWAYDLGMSGWIDMTGGFHPTGRSGHGMAYDAQSDRIIMFGGYATFTGSYFDDTWSYDFNANTWTNMNPAIKPSGRYTHAMTYDSESDRIVLFGGFVPGSGENDETWAYDFNTNTWTNMNPVQPPSARYVFGMAYDAESDRVVLFGGVTFTPTLFDDTWAYDFNTNTWTNMNPAVKPAARSGHAMAYDTLSDRTVMFGGYATGTGLSDETWSYDVNANTWTNMSPTVKPAGRTEFAMAYDSQSDRTVMFGGGTPTEFSDETWWYHHPNYPSAAQTLRAFAGNAQVTLTWLPPASDGDSPITGYRIYRGTSPGGESFLTSLGSVLAFTDTGLTNGIPYYYQVTAVNAIGEGPRSNEAPATPSSGPFAPDTPRNLQATAGNALVTLVWLAPSSDGGSPITNYKVYRGTTSGSLSLVTTLGNVLTHTDTGLTNGVTYYYQVLAVNGVGESPSSNEVSATPTAAPSVPGPPRNLQVAAGNGQVTLVWQAPSADGGSSLTEYRVLRSTSPGGESILASVGNVLTFTDTGLTNGVTYFYQVSAINAIGEGPRSNEVSATPSTTADTTDPAIAITSPSSGATLTATSATVSGTAADNVAVQKVEISSDGTTWVAVTGTTVWSGTLPLGEGANTIYARATDTSGHTATASVSVTVALPVAGQGMPAFVLIGAVVAAAAAAGIAVFLFWRRRRGKGEMGKPST